jgi:hypothetical protein
VSYFFKWIPLVAIATLCILSLPWLGLIALLVVLGALALPAAAILYVPYRFGRAISHRLNIHGGARQRAAAAMHIPRQAYAYASAPRIDYRKSGLGHGTDSISAGGRNGVLGQPDRRERDVS